MVSPAVVGPVEASCECVDILGSHVPEPDPPAIRRHLDVLSLLQQVGALPGA